ncbi:antizyme inhibitor 2-like isoform X1 [Stegostoma tigrinum]|uniref:antizyme inhibitor 2-like isoform X1 n=1 Tax=Stegostoma tigrinum TaxID=3053191 RepID=UPI00202AC483|nr:antizyme inhibitor 2-like isoform X1 [Stegostoma tigrinum]
MILAILFYSAMLKSFSYCCLRMVLRIAVNDFTSQSPLSGKFGASMSECRQLLEYAKVLNLDTIGVSFHVGSGCTDPKIFAQAIADARVVFDIGKARIPGKSSTGCPSVFILDLTGLLL